MALTKVDKSVSSTPGIVDSSNATAITIDSSENVLIGATSGSDPLVVSDSGASSITARFINTNADANPANIRLQKLSSSPADGDYLGMINVSGENDASEETIFQSIDFISEDVSDGTEDGVIAFRTRGAGTLAERLRITEQGFIKLPSKVSFSGTGDAGLGHHTNNYMYIYGGTAGLILQDNSGGSNRILIRDSSAMSFEINGSERARFDSSGIFLKGKTTAGAQTTAGFEISDNGLNTYSTQTSGSVTSTHHVLYGSTFKFYVGYNGYIYAANTTVQSLSDERLKENVRDLDKGLSDILKLKPRRFDWKEGEGTDEKNVSGFIAQEAEDAGFEEFVGDFKHEDLDDAKSFGQGGLIPALVKAIQEQQAIIEDLQTQINEVKNGN